MLGYDIMTEEEITIIIHKTETINVPELMRKKRLLDDRRRKKGKSNN